jgi:hypothetical protein
MNMRKKKASIDKKRPRKGKKLMQRRSNRRLKAHETVVLESPAGYAGGPSTTSGSDFQHQVAAWVMVQLLAKEKSDELWGLGSTRINRVSLETRFALDDISVETDSILVLAQSKEGLSLSDLPSSPLASAIDQVVRSFLQPGIPANAQLMIVAGPGSTLPVVRDLRKVLERLRNPLPLGSGRRSLLDAAVNKDEKRAVSIASRHVARSWRTVKRETARSDEIIAVLKRVHIDAASASDSSLYSREATRLLRTLLGRPQEALAAWSVLVKLAVTLAKDRQSADHGRVLGELEKAGMRLLPDTPTTQDIRQLKKHAETVLSRLRRESSIEVDGELIHIQRKTVSSLAAVAKGGSFVLTGIPGAGKSGALANLADALEEAGHDVIVLDVTTLAHESSGAIRNDLGISQDIGDVLRSWPGHRPAFLIIDALDAARGEVGIRILENLIAESQRLAPRWRVIASIREYDLRNAVRLRSLFPHSQRRGRPSGFNTLATLSDIRHVVLPDFTNDEMTQFAKKYPAISPLFTSHSQSIALLRNPFNLRLATELLAAGEPLSSIRDMTLRVQLLDRYWNARVVKGTDIATADARESVLKRIVTRMIESGRLSIQRSTITGDLVAGAHVFALLQLNIIREYQKAIGDEPDRGVLVFAHHILFDFAVARLAMRESDEAVLRTFTDSPDIILMLRPSLAFHLEWLWSKKPTDKGKKAFWDTVLGLQASQGVRAATRAVGPVVAVALAKSREAFRPIVDAISSQDASQAELGDNVFAELVHARIALVGTAR